VHNKPPQVKNERKPFFERFTAEKIGLAAVGLVALVTLPAVVTVAAAGVGGAVYVSKRSKKKSANKSSKK
jgi:hypothetical protein